MDALNALDALDILDDYLDGGYHRQHIHQDVSLNESGGSVGISESINSDESIDSLDKIAAEVAACRKCGLCEQRRNVVPGEGCAVPLVMVVGEGPGGEEDAQGRPFVGPAGQLLDKMLASVGLSRDKNCYIANTVKCRPPGNRTPQPEETAACRPFLERQLALLQPRVVLCMGNTAIHCLAATNEGVTHLHGRWMKLNVTGMKNTALMPSFHPSALLRDASYKAPAFQDLKALAARLVGLSKSYAEEALPLLQRYAAKDKALAAALPPGYLP
jgi:DNA polymerase